MKFVLMLCVVALVAQQAQAASVETRADLCPDSGEKDMMMCMMGLCVTRRQVAGIAVVGQEHQERLARKER